MGKVDDSETFKNFCQNIKSVLSDLNAWENEIHSEATVHLTYCNLKH